jgi:hypothetical protein
MLAEQITRGALDSRLFDVCLIGAAPSWSLPTRFPPCLPYLTCAGSAGNWNEHHFVNSQMENQFFWYQQTRETH